jgi:8-oxo-dGTP pyrophosphatase MutT (NUDIX family)
MVAGAILPVCLYKGKLHFLFGLENEEADTPGWADFGGGCEDNETPYQTALREGYEESSGFLEPKELVKHGVFKLINGTYHIFIVKYEYNEFVVKYFNRMHEFVKEKKPGLLKSVLFEKQKMEWFSIDDMIHRKKEFRNFYQEIVDKLIQQKSAIKKFIQDKKTRKKRLVE